MSQCFCQKRYHFFSNAEKTENVTEFDFERF